MAAAVLNAYICVSSFGGYLCQKITFLLTSNPLHFKSPIFSCIAKN